MRRIDKPWGYEEIISECSEYLMKRLVVRAGSRLSLQYHEHKTETLFVHWGVASVLRDDREVQLRPGESLHIPAGTIHRIAAPTEDVEIIEASTYFPDDTIRLVDDYGRDSARSGMPMASASAHPIAGD